MARKDELDELLDWQKKKEIEDGIREGVSKWLRTICMTAASAIMGIFYTLGSIAYQKSEAIMAAIKAYLLIDKGGQ